MATKAELARKLGVTTAAQRKAELSRQLGVTEQTRSETVQSSQTGAADAGNALEDKTAGTSETKSSPQGYTASGKATEGEYNRSTAMQEKYGSYANYLNGVDKQLAERTAASQEGAAELSEINALLAQKTAELSEEERKKNAFFLPAGESFDEANYNRLISEIETLQALKSAAEEKAATESDYTRELNRQKKAIQREMTYTNLYENPDQTQQDALVTQLEEVNENLEANKTPSNALEKAQYIGQRAVKGLAGAAEGIINAFGYLFTGDAAYQQLIAAGQIAAAGRLTGNTEMEASGEALAAQARQGIDDVLDNGLQQTADFAERYAEKIQGQYTNPTKGLQIAGEVTETVAQMAPSIVSNFVAPGSGLFPMAVQVFGNSVTEAKKNGASDVNALIYGVAVSAVEVLTEKMFDGVAGVFGKGAADDWVQSGIEKLVKNSPTGQAALYRLAEGLGEGFEEFVSELADNFIDRLLVQSDDRRGQELLLDALRSFGMGALVSAVMSTGGDLIQAVANGTVTAAEAAQRLAEQAAEEFTAEARSAAAEEKTEGAEEAAPKTAEELALPTPKEYATRSTIDAAIRNPAALEALGIDKNGKTNSQLRAEVRARLEAQNAAAEEKTEGAEEAAPKTAEELALPTPQAQEQVQETTELALPVPQTQEQAQETTALPQATNDAAAENAAYTANKKAETAKNNQEGISNESLRGGQERQSAVDGGRPSGELAQNTGAAGNGRGQTAQGVDQIRAETADEGTVSVRDVTGDFSQPDSKSFRLVGPEVIARHPELQAAVDKAKAAGYTLHPIVGRGIVKSNITGKYIYARGFVKGKDIWAQVDAEGVTPEQITDHEAFHIQVRESGRKLLGRARESFLRTHSQAELDALIDEYVEAYFNGEKSDRASVEDIEEELFADIYAGIQIKGGGTELGQYRSEVFGGTSEAAQENTARGPPAGESQEYGTADNQEAGSKQPGGTELQEVSEEEDELPLFSSDGTVKTSIEGLAEAIGLEATRGADGKIHFYYNNEEVTNVTAEHVRTNSGLGALISSSVTNQFISANEATRQYQAAADLMNEIIKTNDPEQVWAFTGAAMFSALKSNADGQYGTTVDFTTVCRKTQEMITAMSRSMMKLHRGLTKKEVTRLQKKIIQSGGTVPCPVCYVFSRWAGIGNVLDHMKSLQEQYASYSTEQLMERQQALAAEIEENVYSGETDAKGKKIKLKDAAGKNMSDSKAIAKLLQEKEDAYHKLAAEQEKLESRRTRTEEEAQRLQEIESEMETLQLEREMLGEYVWIRDVRAQEDYKPVPDNVLFNLDGGAAFATEYPAAWKYRTTRGPSAGKAIVPYADMRIGDIIQGVDKTRSTGDETFTDMTGELTEEQSKAVTNAIARARAQNLIGGQRFQSTSDFRYDYALDYIQAFWEAQAIGSNLQTYTKIIEFAEMVASVGGDVNLSLMPRNKGYEDNHLIYSSVTGIDFEAAKEARSRYDSVQTILVGINDEHIRLALEDSEETGGIYVDFVIPYHASGASVEFIQELVSNLGETYVKTNYQDYSKVQTDTKAKNATAQQKARLALRTKLLTSRKDLTEAENRLLRGRSKDITGERFETLREIEKRALSGDKAAMREYLSWSAGVLGDIYNKMWVEGGSEYGVRLNSKQGATIMPHEYWNKATTRENAYVNGFIFRSYCTSLGLNPRFTGKTSEGAVDFGDFSDSRGYWKTLIDRPMYANDGTYRDQQKVNVTDFNIEMVHSEYGQRNWGKYKVAEPDTARAARVGEEFAEELTNGYVKTSPAFKTGVTAESGVTGADEVSEETVQQNEDIVKTSAAGEEVDAETAEELRKQEQLSEEAKKKYAWENLVAKPPVKVVQLEEQEIPTKGKKLDRKPIIEAAKRGTETISDGNTSQNYVYVGDLGRNVLIGAKGISHGLTGNKTNASTMSTAEVTYKLPEILENSVAINEKMPRAGENSDNVTILYGYAEKQNGDGYIVRSTVLGKSGNQSVVDSVEIYDVLKAMRAKKIGATENSEAPNTEPYIAIGDYPKMRRGSDAESYIARGNYPRTRRDSEISIEELLNLVKQYYPEILPKNVLQHYGMDVEQENGLRASATGEEVDAETLAELEQMEAQENVGTSRNEYRASPALEKLGVKIDTPMVNTVGAERDVGMQRGQNISRKEWNKAVKRLRPTEAEEQLAKDLGSGKLTEQNWKTTNGSTIFNDVNWTKVRELADYWTAVASYQGDKLAQIKRRNRNREEYEAMRLTAGSDNYKAVGMLRLNGNTMKRNMILTAGREAGTKLNERYFDPVTRNSAERIRFVNRMLDRVREFELTKDESQMVQRVIEGSAIAAEVAKMPAVDQEKIKNAAESKDLDDGAQEWGLTPEQKEAARKFKEWQDTIADMEGMDTDKINRAAEAYKSAYNDFYDAINEMLVSHGYGTIGFIKGYAPHMQTKDTMSELTEMLNVFGLDAPVSNLPTEIAGRTEQFKPGKQWNPYFMHRNGDKTDYDVVAGYESYVRYLSNVLYHIDDIQKLRILSNSLRQKYAPEEIRNQIEYAENLKKAPLSEKIWALRQADDDAIKIGPGQRLTAEEAEERIEQYIDSLYGRIKETTRLGNLVSVLDNYTNKLAGKQTVPDRADEYEYGRTALNFGNTLNRWFSESSVVGNLSSALNQIAQVPMVQAELGNRWVLEALKDIISGEVKKADFTKESDFLTGKEGTDSLLAERSWEDSDRQQKRAKVTNAMSIPFEAVDTVASQLIVRAKYLEQVSDGKSHEEALRAADDFAEQVVGNRIQGSKPMRFEEKSLPKKLINTFQLEVANAWSHIRNDLRGDIKEIEKEQGKKAAVKYTAGLLARYTTEAFLLNRFAEAVYGGTPAMFDLIGYILGGVAAGTGETVNGMLFELLKKALGMGDDDDDKEWDTGAALEEFGNLVVGDMPYVRNAASMLGYGDMNLPVPTLPTKTAKSLWDMITGDGTLKEVGNYALKELATWAPGGNQLKKTVQGLQIVSKGGKYNTSGELLYPFDTSGFGGKVKAIKAILFGTGALDANDAYYAAGNRKLGTEQTVMYQEITGSGEDPDEVYDLIMDIRHVEDIEDNNAENKEKRDLIRDADLSDESKMAVYATIFNISDKRAEMFDRFAEAGMDFDDMMDVMDAYYDAYYDEDINTNQKATKLARWADDNLDEDKADMVKEELVFYNSTPASASNYEKMHAAGLDTESSEAVSEALAALEPEDGKDSVSSYQKYRAILDADLTDKEKLTALSAVMEESTYEKVKTAKTHNVPLDAIIDGLEINATTEGIDGVDGSAAANKMKAIDKLSLTAAQKQELYTAVTGDDLWETYDEYASWWTPTKFADFVITIGGYTADKKADGTTVSGSKKKKVIEYIDSLSITNDQKTALYAAAGYKESTVDDCPWWSKLALRTGDYPW